MIAWLKGIVIENNQQSLTLNVHDVGYAVATTQQYAGSLTLGSVIELHIYTHVKEDALELFGFETKQQRSLFIQLLSVSGIGPRTALLILGQGSTAIERAIATADVSFFTSIPRIGKKNAQKIIIELKNKIGSLNELNLQDEPINQEERDITDALVTMGFDKTKVLSTVRSLDLSQPIATVMKQALKQLSNS